MSTLWAQLVVTLLALATCAAFVSVINDLTDRNDDAASGKPNRLAGRSRAYTATLVASTLVAGAFFCFLWRDDVLLVAAYLGSWIAFALYSIPPVRLKTRGAMGVLADASGAHLLPAVVAVLAAYRAAAHEPRLSWIVAVGTWAIANGVRGILWHELMDVENDRRAGVRTLAVRYSADGVARLGAWVVFPIELVALLGVLVQIGSVWPFAFLGAYAILVWLRVLRWHMNVVIVAPRERFLIVLHEYYDALLPVALLIASAIRAPRDWIVLAVHLLLFPTRVLQVLHDLRKLWRERRHPSDW